MDTNTDPVRALIELRTGVEMDAAYDPMGAAKLAALDAAIAAFASTPPGAHSDDLPALLDNLMRAAFDDGDKGREKFSGATMAAREAVLAHVRYASAPPSAPEPEVHSYDPTDQRESVTIRWPDGKCLGYVLDRTRYTDNLPPSAPVGVDFAAVASILRRAMRDGVHYGYRRDFILQQALALEALSQQTAAAGEESSKGADVAQPKRRRYDPSGSLSEYGIFPECDAQPLEHQGDE